MGKPQKKYNKSKIITIIGGVLGLRLGTRGRNQLSLSLTKNIYYYGLWLELVDVHQTQVMGYLGIMKHTIEIRAGPA